ncbi:MAG: hypothetical protein Q8Q67_01390 [bacterium]|nr:hypothetical protein [bacterium]
MPNTQAPHDGTADEIEIIFAEAKQALFSLHSRKMELIKLFKNAADAEEAADILNKIQSLR